MKGMRKWATQTTSKVQSGRQGAAWLGFDDLKTFPQKRRINKKSPIMAIPMASLPATPMANPNTVPKPARLA
jgi:hypothetical protein